MPRRRRAHSDYAVIREFLKKRTIDAREIVRQEALHAITNSHPREAIERLTRFFAFEQKRTGERLIKHSRIHTPLTRVQEEKKKLVEIQHSRRLTYQESAQLERVKVLLAQAEEARERLFEERRAVGIVLSKIKEIRPLLTDSSGEARTVLRDFLRVIRRDPEIERMLREGMV